MLWWILYQDGTKILTKMVPSTYLVSSYFIILWIHLEEECTMPFSMEDKGIIKPNQNQIKTKSKVQLFRGQLLTEHPGILEGCAPVLRQPDGCKTSPRASRHRRLVVFCGAAYWGVSPCMHAKKTIAGDHDPPQKTTGVCDTISKFDSITR